MRIAYKKIVVLLLAVLLLAGCSKDGDQGDTSDDQQVNENGTNGTEDTQDTDDNEEAAGYTFEYNDVVIAMNAKAAPIIEALGDPIDYFEAPSCAFQGLDKTYYYNGFELITYPLNGEDYISSVNFLTDSVTTNEGIYIGSGIDEVITAYGDDYEKEEGFYTYTIEDSYMQFITEGDTVTNITYFAIVGD